MIDLHDMHCTACGACVQSCPQNSLSFKPDEYGFLYPVDNDTCIKCGLCEKVCPIEKLLSKPTEIVHAVINPNIEISSKSSSGGMFSAIAKYVLDQKGVVYGCAFSDNLKVENIRIETIESLYKLQGSKYVQSNTLDTFKKVKSDLENNILVFYCGTPCQIAGLKSFLGLDYDNLITADLICHGVPSQKYFDEYLVWLENKLKGKIKDFSFRDKSTKGWSCIGSVIYEKDGKLRKKVIYPADNYYYYYFLKGYIYRESCYICKYSNLNRVGDFTLGDFWGVEKYLHNIKVSKNGCSLVFINSRKAEDIFQKLDLISHRLNITMATAENHQLKQPVDKSYKRNDLLKEFLVAEPEQIACNFKLTNRIELKKAKAKALIPYNIKVFVKRVVSKLAQHSKESYQ